MHISCQSALKVIDYFSCDQNFNSFIEKNGTTSPKMTFKEY